MGTVERLGVREIGPRRAIPVAAAPAPQPSPPPQAPVPQPQNMAVLAAIQGGLRAIALVLAVRLLLLLALIGAFVLGYMAENQQSWVSFAVLIAYASLTVLPLVALSWPVRPQNGG